MTPAIPPGRIVYAIGDIHGRADLLDRMASLVAQDARGRAARPTTIFLGDYVDRGPDSAAVVERLASQEFPTPIVTLRGNHDDILAAALETAVDPDYHVQLGVDATLRSYGIDPDAYCRAAPAARRRLLSDSIPAAHRAFLMGLPLTTEVGDYFFCHAGVRPGVPLDRQRSHDLLWIREGFLDSDASFGRVVVHGHTPMREPAVRRNAIGIDTGAVHSGVLTALVLEGRERRFLQTR